MNSNQLQLLIDGTSVGSLFALVALGIAVLFSVMRLTNFAQGELIMIGAYAAALVSGALWPVFILVPIVASTIAALLLDRLAFRPVRESDPTTLLMTSFAVSFLLQSLAVYFAGSLPTAISVSSWVTEPLSAGVVRISRLDLFTIGTTLAVLVALSCYLRFTIGGLRMRASAEDFTMSRLLGVKANSVIGVAFAISGGLAGIAALVLVAQGGTATPTMGLGPTLVGFVAAVLGGLGSLAGAVVAGYLIGFTTTILQATLPLEWRSYRDVVVYSLVIAVLLWRPNGLFRSRTGGLDRV
jgi:branched-chain amino acid transport system permease protein